MSAPTTHDPRFVNTKDGVVWVRRAVIDGRGLYAVTDSCKCPEYLMATLAELAEHGIAGSADVLPVPVGPEPQVPRPIAYAAKNTDLLLADAAERSRAAEWPWDMWCRICHIRPTSHRTEAEALEAADRHVKLQHASQAEVHKLMAAGGLSELETLRARVAELEAERSEVVAEINRFGLYGSALPVAKALVKRADELVTENAALKAERHSTNEALDDAVQALRARPSCPCPPADHPHQLGCPQAEVPSPLFPTVASLREVSSREEPHDSPLHHPYTTPHDLDMPATGGVQ